MYTPSPAASRRATARIVRGRHARDGLDALGPPSGDAAPQTVDAVGALREVRLVGQALGDHDVREAEEEREIGAGGRLQVDAASLVGEPDRRRAPRVDHDEAPGVLRAGEVADERRHRRGDVGPQQQDGRCGIQVAQGERHPTVDAERAVARSCGGRHAEAAVVVDAARAEREAGELAQLVGLLVREPAAAEDGNGIRTVRRTDRAQAVRDEVERGIPLGLVQLSVGATHERRGQAIGGAEEFGRGPALLAQAAAIGGEIPTGDDHRGRALRRPIRPRQRHRALESAIRAVGVGGCRDPGGRVGHRCQIRNPSLRLRP